MTQGVQQCEALDAVGRRRRREVRRLGRLDAPQEPDESADLAVEREKRLGVTRPSSPELVRGPGRVAPQRERRPVGGRGESDHVGLDDPEAVRFEPELSHHAGAQASDAVGGNRCSHARSNLLGRERAACTVAAFENERTQSPLRQVPGRDQPVVAGTDDDCVVLLPGHEGLRPPCANEASGRPGGRRDVPTPP